MVKNNDSENNCGLETKVIVVDAVSSVLGGGVTFNVCLINAMAKLGPQYHFYVIAGSQAFIDLLADLPNISSYLIPGRRSSACRFLWRQLILPWQAVWHKADAVVSQFPGIFLSFRPQIMLVLNSHYLMEPPIAKNKLEAFKRRIQRYLYIRGHRHVNKAVFLSHQMAELTPRWTGQDENKNKVIYEAVAPSILSWSEAQNGMPSLNGDPYFIAVGSVAYHKNYETMLKAFASLVRLYPNPVRLKIVGYYKSLNDYNSQKGQIPELIKLTQELEIENKVDWVGEVFGQDLYELLYNSLAFISTSLLEAYPLTAIEAMAIGVPVVVPNTSSYPEVIADSGLYHNPKDASSVCEQMLKIVEQPEIREEYIKKGHNRSKIFRWENAGKECLSLIEEIIKK